MPRKDFHHFTILRLIAMPDSPSSSVKEEQKERYFAVATSFLIIAVASIFGASSNGDYGLLIGAGWFAVAVANGALYIRSCISAEWPHYIEWLCTAVNACILMYIVLS